LSIAILGPSRWTLQSKNGRAGHIDKNLPRVSENCVPDVPDQKSAFSDTWFSNNL